MERFVLLRLPVAMVATQMLFGVLHSIKTSGELGTALHFVPATSKLYFVSYVYCLSC